MAEQADRIVVAGMGAVTAFGVGVGELWRGVRAGEVAIRPVTRLPMAGYRTKLAGEVPVPVIPARSPVTGEFREPTLDFALVAAEEALTASRLDVAGIGPERCGVVFATCNGGLISGEHVLRARSRGATAELAQYLLVAPQMIAEAVGTAFGFRGPVLSVNTACASGAHAIAHAMELLREGHADMILAGGSDSLSGVTLAGFNSLESLAPEPAAPYSKDREGLSLGEGSGMLVLTRAAVAEAHGAPILADVLGYGLSADGYHATAPHPEGAGAARAITAALTTGGVSPSLVGYINGHGTGTSKNDPAEIAAVKTAFGDAAAKTMISSTKSMIGHLLGAAGAVESIVAIRALCDQFAPPTAGFTEIDPQCEMDVVPLRAKPLDTSVVMSNNFAFAGANASVLYGLPDRVSTPVVPTEPIVVTGLAALGPRWTTINQLRCAAAGVERAEQFAEAMADPERELSRKERRRIDRLGRFAVMASAMALADAGLDPIARPAPGIGVVLGTGLGPLGSIEEFLVPLLDEGPASANPAVFPNTVYNAAAGQVAMKLGLTGVTSTLTAAHAAGAAALCVARDLLRRAAADAIVVPAVDVFPAAARTAYTQMGLCRADSAYRAVEGAYAIVLEPMSKALARDAEVLGEFAGFGIGFDGRGLGRSDPDGRGNARAMRTALARAGLQPSDIGVLHSNAAGIASLDRAEAVAVARVFGDRPPRIEAPKRVIGEPGGAGAHLAIALTADRALDAPVLINSSSLGGTHFALVLTPPRATTERSAG
ncbi:3-oxoacyl-[acyl-carrier-protein] synthase II [Nocardia tenerifensis]|uniref:3-oxoacyl-[acyl-carrier-protein] synthase II n=1 Tax=Nocardia tenerifensis TaxID=228006 RepID=A0A318JPZ1_9NOCA|nr:beta-ketoacyl-[acyl-carrier-protein] synthase family protein [Nocardia tenerifensis]PXX55546.1 3-oxoacyl-[acyl-carrier-protein] synthase II [Nocardia tenerifensis]